MSPATRPRTALIEPVVVVATRSAGPDETVPPIVVRPVTAEAGIGARAVRAVARPGADANRVVVGIPESAAVESSAGEHRAVGATGRVGRGRPRARRAVARPRGLPVGVTQGGSETRAGDPRGVRRAVRAVAAARPGVGRWSRGGTIARVVPVRAARGSRGETIARVAPVGAARGSRAVVVKAVAAVAAAAAAKAAYRAGSLAPATGPAARPAGREASAPATSDRLLTGRDRVVLEVATAKRVVPAAGTGRRSVGREVVIGIAPGAPGRGAATAALRAPVTEPPVRAVATANPTRNGATVGTASPTRNGATVGTASSTPNGATVRTAGSTSNGATVATADWVQDVTATVAG